MILIRYILIGLIIYLIVRAFSRFAVNKEPDASNYSPKNNNSTQDKKVSKEIGEYVDYEEVKD